MKYYVVQRSSNNVVMVSNLSKLGTCSPDHLVINAYIHWLVMGLLLFLL